MIQAGLGSGYYYVIEAVSNSSCVFAQNTEFVLQIQEVQVGKNVSLHSQYSGYSGFHVKLYYQVIQQGCWCCITT
jgi:hypothetical protein